MSNTTTINELVSEAIRRSRGSLQAPTTPEIDRGRTVWLPELMADIIAKAAVTTSRGNLAPLHTTRIAIGTINRSRYALPADFDHELSVEILDGYHTDTATAGSATSVTLAADEDAAVADVEGYYILMTAGASKGQYRQVTDYNSTTKVATVAVAWDSSKTPVSGDTYLVVNETWAVEKEAIESMTKTSVIAPGRPLEFAQFESEFEFDRGLDKAYGVLLRYYADPLRIKDSAGALDFEDDVWTRILDRWRRVLTLGFWLMALQSNDDSRSTEASRAYDAATIAIIGRERDNIGQEFERFTA